ncbi:MAG TPA: hypothetical protein VEJ18_00950, partial [Planctomycetota bacterium]|nr:hypothetical protein [Planctomycetota bacterium]
MGQVLRAFLPALASVFGVLSAAAAQDVAGPSDWPQFKRDARRSGDNPDAALRFPLNRTVAVRFPAPLYASPAVVDGKVYVQDARGHVA